MPRKERALQLAASSPDRTLSEKPEPPADLWDALDRIEATDHQPRFDGFTIEEYAARYKVPNRTAQSRLRRYVLAGVLEQGWKFFENWTRVYRSAK